MFNSVFQGIREYWAPVLRSSRFKEDAVLTPDEFVAAGDFLIYKCATWSWESGDPTKRRDYLPHDKQFLVIRKVPCLKSARDLELVEIEPASSDNLNEGGWFTTGWKPAGGFVPDDSDTEIVDDVAISSYFDEQNVDKIRNTSNDALSSFQADSHGHQRGSSSPESIPDMDELVGNATEAAVTLESSGNNTDRSQRGKVLITRTYDIYIVYDKYYRTPRLLLAGYDEERRPLPPYNALLDISSDHANKTVTLESHPHIDMQVASIHPCRHAEAVKRFIVTRRNRGQDSRSEHYLVIFLKLMSSVLPSIDYDHTMELD